QDKDPKEVIKEINEKHNIQVSINDPDIDKSVNQEDANSYESGALLNLYATLNYLTENDYYSKEYLEGKSFRINKNVPFTMDSASGIDIPQLDTITGPLGDIARIILGPKVLLSESLLNPFARSDISIIENPEYFKHKSFGVNSPYVRFPQAGGYENLSNTQAIVGVTGHELFHNAPLIDQVKLRNYYQLSPEETIEWIPISTTANDVEYTMVGNSRYKTQLDIADIVGFYSQKQYNPYATPEGETPTSLYAPTSGTYVTAGTLGGFGELGAMHAENYVLISPQECEMVFGPACDILRQVGGVSP
ncbi:hypothetical protein ACFL0F_01245, partial [Patescibacteria group bacterium]